MPIEISNAVLVSGRSSEMVAPEGMTFRPDFDLIGVAFGMAAPAGVYDPRMHALRYRWTFGDQDVYSAPINLMPGHEDRNTATGFEVAHVYRAPGTYTVRLDVTGTVDGAPVEAYSERTVTVGDPATIFAGSRTYFVSPSSDWSLAPSGSQHVASLDDAAGWANEDGAAGPYRIMLNRGENHAWGGRRFGFNADVATTIHIVAGPGSGARPTLDCTGGFATGANNDPGAANTTFVLQGLVMTGPYDPVTGIDPEATNAVSLWDPYSPRQILIDRCEMRGFGHGIYAGYVVPRYIYLHDTIIEGYGEWGVMAGGYDVLSILGCSIMSHVNAPVDNAVNMGGTLRTGGGAQSTLIQSTYIHPRQGWSGLGGGYIAVQPCIRLEAEGLTNRRINVTGCTFEGGFTIVSLSRGDDLSVPQNALLEHNYLLGTYQTSTAFGSSCAGGMTARNNTVVMPATTQRLGPGLGAVFALDHNGSGESLSAPVRIYDNIIVNLTGDTWQIVSNPGGYTDLVVADNIVHQPNLSPPQPSAVPLVTAPPLWTPREIGYRSSTEDLRATTATPAGVAASYAPLVLEGGDAPGALMSRAASLLAGVAAGGATVGGQAVSLSAAFVSGAATIGVNLPGALMSRAASLLAGAAMGGGGSGMSVIVTGDPVVTEDFEYEGQTGTLYEWIGVDGTVQFSASGVLPAELVAGGASGGRNINNPSAAGGGGGGGGGVLQVDVSVTGGVTYDIAVGQGGAAATLGGNAGGDSDAFGHTAVGGGAGGGGASGGDSSQNGGAGGSGGGGAGEVDGLGGAGTPGQGYAGAPAQGWGAGGGGGASGTPATPVPGISGPGGVGVAGRFRPELTFGSGGGGSGDASNIRTPGAGGPGAGDGGYMDTPGPTGGTDGMGGGGGGANYNHPASGPGGSGRFSLFVPAGSEGGGGGAAVSGVGFAAAASLSPGAATAGASLSGQTLSRAAALAPGAVTAGVSLAGQTLSRAAALAPGAATAGVSLAGLTLSRAASLAPGAVTAGASLAGQTFARAASLLSGSAGTGEFVPGQTLARAASLAPGAVTAGVSLAGQTLSRAASLLSGSVSVGVGLAGQILQAVLGWQGGTASGGADVEGRVVSAATSLVAGGAAAADPSASVSGQVFSRTAVLLPGAAVGQNGPQFGLKDRRRHFRAKDAHVHKHLGFAAIYLPRPDQPGRVIQVRRRASAVSVEAETPVQGYPMMHDAGVRLVFDQDEVASPMLNALVLLSDSEAYRVRSTYPARDGYVTADVQIVEPEQAKSLWLTRGPGT